MVQKKFKRFLTERDKSKIKQFPIEQKLKLLIDQSIQPYLDYTKSKYGNNFIQLYNGSPDQI